MSIKHVIAPNKGMITNISPTTIDPLASPFINGCYLEQGSIVSDYGYVPYPTPSNTQSNQLIGTLLTIEDFNLSSGIEYLLAFTTQYIYNWNTQTMTWDVVNQGVLVDSAENVWTGSTNVTTTADTTIKIRGTKSSKNIIATAFTTGIVSYHNFSSVDVSATNLISLSLWVYSTITHSNDVFRIRLSEQNSGGTGATYADYTIPSINANIWTHVSIPIDTPVASNGGTYPNDLNAVLSVALIAHIDPGVGTTLYLDDIEVVQTFTGTEDNRFSLAVIYDTLIITNGVDAPSQIIDNSGPTHSTISLPLPTGDLQTSEVAIAFMDHVLFMNNTENGADVPQRVTWTNIGTIDDLVDGTSGFQDLTDNQDIIIGAAIFSEYLLLIYKENSIVACSWVGGHTPFRFDPLVYGYGALSKDSILSVEGYHVVIDDGDIYVCNGTASIQTIGTPIDITLFNNLNGQYAARTWTRFNKIDNEIEFWICYQDSTPDQGFTFNQNDTNWFIRSRNISGFGTYQSQSFLTIGELIGTIAQQNFTFGSQVLKSFSSIILVGTSAGQVFQLNKTSMTNNGAPIPSEFQTPDFVCPETPDFENKSMRVSRLMFEASGVSVTTQFSIDGGMTWFSTQGKNTNITILTSTFQEYEQFFETDAKKIRFRFIGGPFSIRYYAFDWMLRSGRR